MGDMHPPVLRPMDQQHGHVGDVLSSGQQVPILHKNPCVHRSKSIEEGRAASKSPH